jgi:hypothetical protein
MNVRMSQMLNVTPNTELVVTIGTQTFVHRIADERRLRVEISERPVGSVDVDRPEIGAPTLMENIRTR